MEAFRLYKDGFDWRITEKDAVYLNKDQVKYEVLNFERELVSTYFAVPAPGESCDLLTSSEIILELEKFTRKNVSINIVGREMNKLGFIKKTVRIANGGTDKKWSVNRINRTVGLNSPTQDEKDEMPF